MFNKTFVVKSNTNVRSSDKRKLLAQLSPDFKTSSKSVLSFVKIVSANGTPMGLHCCDKEPILFTFANEKSLFPTVYTMWLDPTCVPTLLICPSVMEYIKNGADLMLPGVYVPTNYLFPEFQKDVPIAVAVYYPKTETISPIAVGCSVLSSRDMLLNGMRGKGVNILHVYLDCLWEFGSKSKPPEIPLSNVYKQKDAPLESVEQQLDNVEIADDNEDQLKSDELDASKAAETSEEPTTEDIDELELKLDEGQPEEALPGLATAAGGLYPISRQECAVSLNQLTKVFLWTLKVNGSSICLPTNVGQFYATYILKQLPPDTKIDLKKTSFKKFGNFLKVINEDGMLIKVASKKGVDLIEEINLNDDRIKGAEPVEGVKDGSQEKLNSVRVSECYSVNQGVMPFVELYGYKRGEIVQPNRLNELVLQYGISNNLLSQDKKKIELDDRLQSLIGHFLPDKILVNELAQKIGSRMTKTHVITFPDGRKNLHRNGAPLIRFKVEKRSGNKIVTLINNTASFGIDTSNFCKSLQSMLATGATINQEVVNCEGPQILLHGNHVFFIGELLKNSYGIERKYMKGLELGVKPKKKKQTRR